jgi:hypothetical protein
MVGYPRHRVTLPLAHLPGGEHDLQFLGDQPGILIEGLVEIAQAEEDDGLRIASLYLEILVSNRCHGTILSGLFYRNSLLKESLKSVGAQHAVPMRLPAYN